MVLLGLTHIHDAGIGDAMMLLADFECYVMRRYYRSSQNYYRQSCYS